MEGFLVQPPQQGGKLGEVYREEEWSKARSEWKRKKNALERGMPTGAGGPRKCYIALIFFTFIILRMYVCMHRHPHTMACAWRSKDKVWELALSLPPCDSWRSDSGCQTWCQVLLPIEPSCCPPSWTLTPGGRTEG